MSAPTPDGPPAPGGPPPATARPAATGRGVEHWSDAAKVLLVSGLTLPFALGWVLRCLQLQDEPALSPYVSRAFLPVMLPVLWLQLIGHLGLIVAALAIRRRGARRTPWLVHAEVQLWVACLCFSLYAVGTLTSPLALLMLVLPVIGYHLFEARPMHLGLVTMTVGIAAGIVLPQVHVAPYAPFLAHAPFADHALNPAWVVSFGVPAIFATAVGVLIHTRLVHRLRERQAELERLSNTDALTGLANRTVFFTRLQEELARARRYHLPLCVIMIDVDHFKRINDSRGHLAGDRVLRELGHQLRGSLRIGDVAARYGGEEFAVLLPHTALGEAAMVGERLLGVARTVRVARPGEAATLTVSAGVAERGTDEDGDALVARADAALYQSKRDGRDRLTVAATP